MNKSVFVLVIALILATGAFAQGKSVSFDSFVVQMKDFILQKLEDRGFDVSSERSKAPDFAIKVNAAVSTSPALLAYSVQVQFLRSGSDKVVARKIFKGYKQGANDFPDDLSTEIVAYLKDVLK